MMLLILLLCGSTLGMWVKEMENKGLFEGDIVLSPNEKGSANAFGSMKGRRWKNGIVPYEFEPSMSSYAKSNIKKAIAQYHQHTCLKFVPRTNEWTSYISFYRGDGCHSAVGNLWIRKNRISLGSGCLRIGTIMHEIGHAIGLYHEQSRPDRDQYVKILWENIPKDMQSNFKKHSTFWINSLGTPYDFRSLMHYDSTAFGHGRTTIQTVDPKNQNLIGQNRGFSVIDIKQINLMYNCKK